MRTRWAVVALGLLAACGPGTKEAPEGVGRVDPVGPSTSVDRPTASTEAPSPSPSEAMAPTSVTPRPSTYVAEVRGAARATTRRTGTSTTVLPAPAADPGLPRPTIDIVYELERHATDEATANFEALAEATLSDARGWSRAAFGFERRSEVGDAPYRIILAEGEEVDRLCLPYDTYGKYSCQNGPVVALNADRWRASAPKWTGDLESYRRMLINHEVGHLLGQKHPRPQCPATGTPAPVMNQQSTELNGCLPNPWPLDSEVNVAARHDRKIAPGPGE